MRVLAQWKENKDDVFDVPRLSLYVFGAPHRRVDDRVIDNYRRTVYDACQKAGVVLPISVPIDLSAVFVDPTSPDLDNLLTALYRSIDGSTSQEPVTILDDGLVQKVTMMKMFVSIPSHEKNPNLSQTGFTVGRSKRRKNRNSTKRR